MDVAKAFAGPKLLRSLHWRLNDRRPVQIDRFSESVVERCGQSRPEILIATGIALLTNSALRKIATLGVVRTNFQTDDPWNPAHRSRWYLNALPEYDYVFTPRTATFSQLRMATAAKLNYLPFGYDPGLFYPETDASVLAQVDECDVLFGGGADHDRLASVKRLIDSGLKLALYGGYWDKHAFAKPFYRGMACAEVLRAAHAKAKVAVGMVRRANRDGNSMRTYELAAMGTSCVMEDTDDHRTLFGPEGEAVLYFSSPQSLVDKCKLLCTNEALRSLLAVRVREKAKIGHSYEDRLKSMLTIIHTDRTQPSVVEWS